MVEAAQNWLNETYGMNLEITGHTGTIVVGALITALQKELGIATELEEMQPIQINTQL